MVVGRLVTNIDFEVSSLLRQYCGDRTFSVDMAVAKCERFGLGKVYDLEAGWPQLFDYRCMRITMVSICIRALFKFFFVLL